MSSGTIGAQRQARPTLAKCVCVIIISVLQEKNVSPLVPPSLMYIKSYWKLAPSPAITNWLIKKLLKVKKPEFFQKLDWTALTNTLPEWHEPSDARQVQEVPLLQRPVVPEKESTTFSYTCYYNSAAIHYCHLPDVWVCLITYLFIKGGSFMLMRPHLLTLHFYTQI